MGAEDVIRAYDSHLGKVVEYAPLGLTGLLACGSAYPVSSRCTQLSQ